MPSVAHKPNMLDVIMLSIRIDIKFNLYFK